jgi:hypothetical protein
MHNIEPFYRWRDFYIAAEDEHSPFYGHENSEFMFTHSIYNFLIHPQWDEIGSPTLFAKLIFADYDLQFAVLELMGEWNDCIHNDIMFLKRNVIDPLEREGINKFLLIGENVLNFHKSDDCYYEEWASETTEEGGWVLCLNFREHVLEEMRKGRLHHHLLMGERYNQLNWRTFEPVQLLEIVDDLVIKALPE